MKKIIALLASVLLVASFAACGTKVPCSICGEEKSCKTVDMFGEKVYICSDCESGLNQLANLF